MTKKDKPEGSKGGGVGRFTGDMAAPISDARFSKMETDPRFRNVPKKQRKVVVDDRFKVASNATQSFTYCLP